MKENIFNNIRPLALPTPSCRFRIPNHGGRVLWQVTNICNYTCSYCIFGSGPYKVEGELNTKIIYKTLSDLVAHDFISIKFTGGEPFTRPDIIEIVEHACSLGISVDLSTNASLVTKVRAQRLKTAGVEMVHVSLDGPNFAVHEAVRGKRTFELTCRGLDELLKHQIYIRVGCVIFAGNENHLCEMVDFCSRLGVSEIIFSRMEPAGRMHGDLSKVATHSNDSLQREIDSLQNQYATRIKVESNLATTSHSNMGTCPAPDRFLFIDNLGRVSPCSWIAEHTSVFQGEGTLRTNSLSEILDSPQFDHYRKVIRQEAKRGQGGCPIDWQGSPFRRLSPSLNIISNFKDHSNVT